MVSYVGIPLDGVRRALPIPRPDERRGNLGVIRVAGPRTAIVADFPENGVLPLR